MFSFRHSSEPIGSVTVVLWASGWISKGHSNDLPTTTAAATKPIPSNNTQNHTNDSKYKEDSKYTDKPHNYTEREDHTDEKESTTTPQYTTHPNARTATDTPTETSNSNSNSNSNSYPVNPDSTLPETRFEVPHTANQHTDFNNEDEESGNGAVTQNIGNDESAPNPSPQSATTPPNADRTHDRPRPTTTQGRPDDNQDDSYNPTTPGEQATASAPPKPTTTTTPTQQPTSTSKSANTPTPDDSDIDMGGMTFFSQRLAKKQVDTTSFELGQPYDEWIEIPDALPGKIHLRMTLSAPGAVGLEVAMLICGILVTAITMFGSSAYGKYST